MKFTSSTLALAAILGLALVSAPTIQAQTTAATTTTAPATTPAPKAKKPSKTEYHGTLTAVDAAAGTITLSGKTAKTLAIASTTKIKKDGKPATLADFAVGEKVTGSYTTDATGKLTAASLYFKTPKAATTTAKTAAKTAPAAAPAAAPASNPAPAAQ